MTSWSLRRIGVNLREFQCILNCLRLQHGPPSVTPAQAEVQKSLENSGFPPSRE